MPKSISLPILPPKSNTVFQLLFGNPRNIELLADFLLASLRDAKFGLSGRRVTA